MPHIDQDVKLDFKDVLIRPKRSTLVSRNDVSLERTFTMPSTGRKWTGIPIVAANMDTTGTFEMAEVMASRRLLTAIHKHYTLEQWALWFSTKGKDISDFLMVSTGILAEDLEKLDKILKLTTINTVCIDVANGYSEGFVKVLQTLRKKYQSTTIVAGNVVTGEMTEELILSGADIVKVGIGPGSVCTTRKQTGVGYPQLSAVIECADAAHGLGGLIISDGGCTCPGDVAKAFGAGADYVMLGGMMAGHDECAGDLLRDTKTGKLWQNFYGMSSQAAMEKYAGGVKEYRSSEGKNVLVPYRGSADETARDLLGGLRSSCTYVGAKHLKELSRRTTFIRVTQQLNPKFDEQPSLDGLEPVDKS